MTVPFCILTGCRLQISGSLVAKVLERETLCCLARSSAAGQTRWSGAKRSKSLNLVKSRLLRLECFMRLRSHLVVWPAKNAPSTTETRPQGNEYKKNAPKNRGHSIMRAMPWVTSAKQLFGYRVHYRYSRAHHKYYPAHQGCRLLRRMDHDPQHCQRERNAC